MTPVKHEIEALSELRESLVSAAERELTVAPRRRRRNGRRTGLIAVVVGLVVAGGAGATQLLSIGEPVPEVEPTGAEPFRPDPADPITISVRAPDPAGGLSWGVFTFKGKTGRDCVNAGQVLHGRVGVQVGDEFRPYKPDARGACDDLRRHNYHLSFRRFHVGTPRERTLLFGSASKRVARVRVTVGKETGEARVARDGAFLFVFEGDAESPELKLTFLDAQGRVVPHPVR